MKILFWIVTAFSALAFLLAGGLFGSNSEEAPAGITMIYFMPLAIGGIIGSFIALAIRGFWSNQMSKPERGISALMGIVSVAALIFLFLVD